MTIVNPPSVRPEPGPLAIRAGTVARTAIQLTLVRRSVAPSNGEIDDLSWLRVARDLDVSAIRCFNTFYDDSHADRGRRRATGPGRSRSADVARQCARKHPACRSTEGTNRPTVSASRRAPAQRAGVDRSLRFEPGDRAG